MPGHVASVGLPDLDHVSRSQRLKTLFKLVELSQRPIQRTASVDDRQVFTTRVFSKQMNFESNGKSGQC